MLNEAIPKRMNEIAKGTARTVLETIVEAMPVDTSKAVSNWQLAYSDPDTVPVIEPHYPGSRGSTRDQSSAETLFIGGLFIDGKRPGQELHIVNNADYIDDINEPGGSSSPGFKEKGIRAGEEYVSKQELGLKL